MRSSDVAATSACISRRIWRRWRTASTMLPLPASPLVRIIAAPSPMRRSASPSSRAPQTKGTRKSVLVDVVLVVGRRQDLALVDEVDVEGFEDARLQQVPDAALRHDRDRHRGAHLLDALDGGHARDAAFPPDVRGHALERHHGRRAGVLGDAGLLGGRDVEDDAALQHLGERGLQAVGVGLHRFLLGAQTWIATRSTAGRPARRRGTASRAASPSARMPRSRASGAAAPTVSRSDDDRRPSAWNSVPGA